MPNENAQQKADSQATTPTRYASLVELLVKLALVGGPVLYVLGRVYAHSYWSALNVPSTLMRVSTEDYVYYGFNAMIGWAVQFLPTSESYVFVITLLLTVLLLGVLTLGVWIVNFAATLLVALVKRIAQPIRALLGRQPTLLPALQTASRIYDTVLVVAIGILIGAAVLLTPIAIADSAGKTRAQIAKDALAADDNKSLRVRLQSTPDWEGVLVDCATRYCVVWSKGDFTVAPEDDLVWNHSL